MDFCDRIFDRFFDRIFIVRSMLILITFLSLLASSSSDSDFEKIYLGNISSLTFYQNKTTTYRKSLSFKQLECVANCIASPDNVTCININVGSLNDSVKLIYSIMWSCVPFGMTDNFNITNTVISCEGYDYEQDVFVVNGSCNLKYEIACHDDCGKLSMAPIVITIFAAVFLFVVCVTCLIKNYYDNEKKNSMKYSSERWNDDPYCDSNSDMSFGLIKKNGNKTTNIDADTTTTNHPYKHKHNNNHDHIHNNSNYTMTSNRSYSHSNNNAHYHNHNNDHDHDHNHNTSYHDSSFTHDNGFSNDYGSFHHDL
jgi:hypothetical protein